LYVPSKGYPHFSFCNQGPVKKCKSKSAQKFQITIRLQIRNQSLMKKSQSKSAQKIQIGIRLKNQNQGSIDPDQVSNRDHTYAENFYIRIRFKIPDQSLPGIF